MHNVRVLESKPRATQSRHQRMSTEIAHAYPPQCSRITATKANPGVVAGESILLLHSSRKLQNRVSTYQKRTTTTHTTERSASACSEARKRKFSVDRSGVGTLAP